jgi:PAS domain S-box-containing protein
VHERKAAPVDSNRVRSARDIEQRTCDFLSVLVDSAPFGVYVVDDRFRLHAVNEGAEAVFRGVDPLVERDFAEVLRIIWPEPFATELIARFRHTLATGEPYLAPPFTRDRHDVERTESYDWRLQRLTLPDGSFGVVCYFYDLTPQRQAMQHAGADASLRDTEARLQRALEAATMGTFQWNIEEDRGEPDARMLALFGLSVADNLNLAAALATMLHPDDRARYVAAVGKATDPEGTGRLREDIRVVHADGSVHWLAITAQTVFEGGRATHMAGMGTDISDRKSIEAALRRSEERLKDADRRKDEFLAVLAHELRNPLAPIRTGLEVIRLAGNTPDAVSRVRAMMERQVGNMVRLVDDLLDVARITSGKISLQRQPTALAELVDTAVEAHRAALETHGIALIVDVPEPAVSLDVDPARFVQLLSNLLHNAIKFSAVGGQIHVIGAVKLARPDTVPELTLSVVDSGVGIAPDMLPRVFDLFIQGAATATTPLGGLGIGLALARRLVEMHGGSIGVESEGAGRGSVFTIRLPISTVAAPPLRLEPALETRELRQRVLVIDDSRDAADTLAMLVETAGGEGRVAYDGEDGLRQALEHRPDVILLDIGLPGIDGYETCRRIRRALGSAVVVIAVTGYGQERDKAQASSAGFDSHLTKPVDVATLEKRLASIKSLR